MSPIWFSLVTALGGVLAGLALAGGLLWHQQQVLRRARHAAGHDDITGLPNRRALLVAVRRALTRGRPCGLVLLDLDDFKTINDTLGHEAGNDLLTAVGRRLSHLGAPVVCAARLSGDEFALLVHGDADATAAAARLAWQAISTAPVPVGPHQVAVRASAGYATARLGLTARDLLRHADQAMYQAKTRASGVAGYGPTSDDDPPPRRRHRDRHP